MSHSRKPSFGHEGAKGAEMREPTDDCELEIYKSMFRLADAIMSRSRTYDSGRLRLLAAQHIIIGESGVNTIAKRTGVSPRRVFQALSEVRAHCEISPLVAHPKE